MDPNDATKTGMEGIDEVDEEVYERFWEDGEWLP
jgi:hypothetical protein